MSSPFPAVTPNSWAWANEPPAGTGTVYPGTNANDVDWNSVNGVNVLEAPYNAAGDGVTDDTAAIQAALNTGAPVYLGTAHLLSAPLLPPKGGRLIGRGRWATQLILSSGFTGAAAVVVSQADWCTVEHLRITSQATSSASAPANVDGIQVVSARNFIAHDLDFLYLNGYCVQLLGSTTLAPYAPYGAMLSRLHCQSVNGGIHLLSNSTAGNYPMQAWLTDLNLEGVDGPLDALRVEDCEDVLIEQVNGAAASGLFLHVIGNCATIFCTNLDLGYYNSHGAAPTNPIVLIESGVNGSPTGVNIANGVFQGGTNGMKMTAGTDCEFTNCHFTSNQGTGLDVEAGSAIYASFVNCHFNNNAKTSGTYFDAQVNNASARVLFNNCWFRTQIGAGVAGKVTAPVYAQSSGRCEFADCYFDTATLGTITTAFYNASFPATKLPYRVKGCHFVNPVGSVTATVGASPWTSTALPVDATYYVSGGTVSSIAVGGVTLTGITSGPVVVPAQSTITITYTAAPTVVCLGN